jgi:hypothetical protein
MLLRSWLKETASLNIPNVVDTLDVSQVPISPLKEDAPLNMSDISERLDVFQVIMIPLKKVAPRNMSLTFMTLDTSHQRSSLKSKAFWNKPGISVNQETYQIPIGQPYISPLHKLCLLYSSVQYRVELHV